MKFRYCLNLLLPMYFSLASHGVQSSEFLLPQPENLSHAPLEAAKNRTRGEVAILSANFINPPQKKCHMNHLEALHDVSMRIFIEDLISKYWDISGMPVHRIPIMLNILATYADEPEFALQMVLEKYPDLTQKNSTFYTIYQQARTGKFKMLSDRLAPYLKEGVIADVGGEDTRLVDELLELNPRIAKAYVTDINVSKSSSNNPKVEFIQQLRPDATPLAKDSVDTVIMATVLHHIETPTRIKLLSHIQEILKDGGRLILVEDTFPDAPLESDVKNELEERFFDLSYQQKIQILGFLDWWGNRLMKNSREIPIPCTFKSIDEWNRLLAEFGIFQVDRCFLGIPEMHTHVMAPKAILIYEKRSVTSGNEYLSPLPAISMIETIRRSDTNKELLAFLPKKRLHINLSIGGSKIQTAVVDSHGEIKAQGDEYPWRKNLREYSKNRSLTVKDKRDWLVDCIVDEIDQALINSAITPERYSEIEGIGIAWAGPVKKNGLTVGPNIEGFKFADISEVEEEQGGVDLAAMVKRRLRQRFPNAHWSVRLLNDGDAAAIANFKYEGLRDGLLLTIGTGIGSGIVRNGAVMYSVDGFKDRLGEIGHHILFHPQYNRYFYYGVLTRGRILYNMTPHSISERLAGPGMTRRFLTRLKRDCGHESSKMFTYLNEYQGEGLEFSEIELAACEENANIGPIVEKKVIRLITEKAIRNDLSARLFIKEVGYEIGLGLGVFIKEFETEDYIKHIILSGSVGKNFGRGVTDENGNDLFLVQILKGIEWSKLNHQSEMNAPMMIQLNPELGNGVDFALHKDRMMQSALSN